MTPRRYRMAVRRESTERTRAALVRSARALLSARAGVEAFTIDAVARKAGVARMTVYLHFASKKDLIEAVFDSLAVVRSGVPRLVLALGFEDPHETLAEFVRVFADVWQPDRVVIRRLQGLAAIDTEFGRAWRTREERRRDGLRAIVERIGKHGERRGRSPSATATAARHARVTDALYAIIAFETYDVIAGRGRRLDHAVATIHQLALAALRLDGMAARSE